MAGIYIHIPFCKQKCTYCDFASFPKEIGKAEAYFGCLYREMRSRAKLLKDKKFNTVYFGGGTPSYVDSKYIFGAMRLIRQEYTLEKDVEITLEMNPGTVTAEKFAIYEKAGINRYSIGLQCADDEMLRDLNRIHTTNDFINTVSLLKEKNISADIMFGLPNQTKEQIKKTIDLAAESGVNHISYYALKPEEGTIMYSRYLNGDLPSEDEIADFYDFGVEYLKTLGYYRYEVSNFAKKGFESKHNSNYWLRGEYIGFGVAASSFIDERRFTNTESIDEYIHLILNGKFAEVFSENIEGDEQKFEYVMLALRTSRGIVLEEYKNKFGGEFMTRFGEKVKMLMPYLNINEKTISIKDEYLFVQNNIIIQFMD